MSDEEIADAVLQRLYVSWFDPNVRKDVNLNDYAAEVGIDQKHIWEAFYRLQEQDLVRSRLCGPFAAITTRGVIHSEERGLADKQIAHSQARIRSGILEAAADCRENQGVHNMIPYANLCSMAGVSEMDFLDNRELLLECGRLEHVSGAMYRITAYGLENVVDSRRRAARLEQFRQACDLTGITPQRRGHTLEDLLKQVAESEGWEVEARVRGRGEEHDLILHRGLDYFICSCKWEKSRVQPNGLRDVESALRNRAGTRGGLLLSMSGFTANCIAEARSKIGASLILLFGPADIEAALTGDQTLTNMLNDKLQEAMLHRRILVDGLAY